MPDYLIVSTLPADAVLEAPPRLVVAQVVTVVTPAPPSGGGGGGAVASVFGRTGVVVAGSADYAAFYDELGAADTAQSDAQDYADTAATAAIRKSGPAYASGLYYVVPEQGSTSTGNTSAATGTQPFTAPFIVDRAITLVRIGIEVTTLLAASTIRLGIYNDNNGVPGTVVIDAGTVSGAATGVQEITISQALTPGRYWAHVGGSSGSTLQVKATATTGNLVGRTTASVASGFPCGCYQITSIANAAAMANNPTVTDGPGSVPRMLIKVS